jgi:hypothetical protein
MKRVPYDSEHSSPGTPGHPRSGSWVREAGYHRVIRSDGMLGGFSMGLNLKERLLALEGVQLPQGIADTEGITSHFRTLSEGDS